MRAAGSGEMKCAKDNRTPASRFARDERGTTSIIFGLMFTFFMLAIAVAVDWGLGVTEKLREQEAIDSATLAASEKLGLEDEDAQGKEVAEAFFKANTGNDPTKKLESIDLDGASGSVTATALNTLKSFFLRSVHLPDQKIGAYSRVLKSLGSVEVALVLDNSGSMGSMQSDGQTSIQALRSAAKQLVSVLLVGAEGTERVRVGVVPFAASVNVGSANRSASWIDSASVAPTHDENFAARDLVTQKRTRFELFDAMGVSWRGCVEARPSPHDVSDAEPDSATPSTLFVPMFAPDEPGTAGESNSYPNSYLDDNQGNCPKSCSRYSRRGNCTQWSYDAAPTDPAVAQARTCKYDGESPSSGKPGPNQGCTTSQILPLTSTRTDIDTAIDAMGANGSTNIPEGIMWGWRVLSPEPPFTQGREWDDVENGKYMIVMTDGKNEITNARSNMNKSDYTAFGYGAKNRMGTDYTYAGYQTALNVKTAAACAAAKAKGIKIYTVAFRLTDAMTVGLLRDCASKVDNAFTAGDSAGLVSVFQAIGRDITKLRVAG